MWEKGICCLCFVELWSLFKMCSNLPGGNHFFKPLVLICTFQATWWEIFIKQLIFYFNCWKPFLWLLKKSAIMWKITSINTKIIYLGITIFLISFIYVLKIIQCEIKFIIILFLSCLIHLYVNSYNLNW